MFRQFDRVFALSFQIVLLEVVLGIRCNPNFTAWEHSCHSEASRALAEPCTVDRGAITTFSVVFPSNSAVMMVIL